MVEQVNAQKLAGFGQPLGDAGILDAGTGIAAGVVVGDDNRSGADREDWRATGNLFCFSTRRKTAVPVEL